MLSTTTNRMDYHGNGVIRIFAYDFLVLDSTHLKVYVNNVLQAPAAYTVSDVGDPLGGNVTFAIAPGNLLDILIYREVPITQLVDYIAHDTFPAETHEAALDKLTMIDQQHEERFDRTLSIPVGSTIPGTTTPLADIVFPVEAGKLLAWDALGTAIIGVPHTVGFGTYGIIVFDVPYDMTVRTNATPSFIVRSSVTIVEAYAYTRTIPTGANLIFDIHKNGTTIWNTQANRLKILAGASIGSTIVFDTTSLIAGDRLDIDIDQIGSTIAGADITVELKVIETV